MSQAAHCKAGPERGDSAGARARSPQRVRVTSACMLAAPQSNRLNRQPMEPLAWSLCGYASS